MRRTEAKDGTIVVRTSSRNTGFATELLRSSVKKFDLPKLRAYQEGHLERLRAGIRTPFYQYTTRESTVPEDQQPYLMDGYLEWTYHTALPTVNSFVTALEDLTTFGRERMPERPDGEVYLEAGEFVLARSYTLHEAMRAFIATPATIPQGRGGYTPIMLESARIMAHEIGTEKDPAIIETLRRHIPRWLTYPLAAATFEVEPLPWIPYSQRRAGFLVDQDTIDRGQAPFLIAMRSADRAAARGDSDESYVMKTHAVISLLEMERERGVLTENAEVPFFTFIMGGILAGAKPDAPKNAEYNYASSLSEMLRDTFMRYQQEKAHGTPAQATEFLKKLAPFYADSYPELLAMAMVDADRLYDGVNLIGLIKGLREEDAQWVTPAIKDVRELGERRVLHVSELAEAEAGLPAVPESGVLPAEELIEDVSLVLGSADMFSFQSRLPQVGSPDAAVTYGVSIDLNRISEKIEARISFTDDYGSRYLPFSLSFSGESESLEFALLDTEMLDTAQSDRLRSLVATLIHNRANEIRTRRAGSSKGASKASIADDEKAEPLRIQILSRPEKLALYQAERVRPPAILGKVKTRNASAEPSDASDAEVVATAESNTNGLVVENLTEQDVQILLKEERIQGVSPQNLVDKIGKMALYAGQTKAAFGKIVRREGDIDLRQLKFVTDGGNTGIRVYLEAKGDGTFVIQGILLKKGENQETKYITNLMTKIKKQHASAETEAET